MFLVAVQGAMAAGASCDRARTAR